MTRFSAPIAEQIWDMKYRLKEHDGTIIDHTVEDTWSRIAKALAAVEKRPEDWESIFYYALEDFKFLPAGRIISGAGTKRSVTLFNCFVMGTIGDNLTAIFDALKEAALTMQQGGGVGYDFSTIRPKGALVKGVAADASGPLSFMDVWDSMCRTIMSAGSRRGAMMATMRCDHPDIEAFIEVKRDPAKLRMFNLSVLVTDPFMDAVKNDLPWDLVFGGRVYKTVQARDLWNKIMQNTYDFAEPGVIFIDRINKANNLHYVEKIAATNPCVSGDTPILTENGWEEIQNLVGKKTKVWNGSAFSEVVPQITGHNRDMVTVFLSDGSQLRCTTNHKFITENGERIEAQHLKTDQKLQKSLWPIISGTEVLSLDYYGQGFFSGDGWVKESTQGQYIGLYGEKKNINHQWNEQSRSTYAINGGYQNTDTSQTKEYLFFRKGTFKSKDFVPFNSPIDQKRQWLAGLADADGTVTFDGSLQITSKSREFLANVKLLLNTMGANGNLQAMKDCWRISISASYMQILNIPTNRLQQVAPSRDARRFLKVIEVVPSGKEDTVFCFTELLNHAGVFNGVYTGQCGEQPLPPYGACLLGSINLAKLIEDPFGKNARLDLASLDNLVHIAVRMMDNVIDASGFPLDEQLIEAKAKRRIGLGVTGLADALLMIGAKYGTEHAVQITERWMKAIARSAYLTSVDLAKEKGSFPCFDAEQFLASGNMLQMDEDVRTQVRLHGIRNALLTSIAPTGTISLFAGNVSSGIEPVFAYSYTRKVRQKDETKREEEVVDYAVQMWREKFGDAPLPDYFVNAQTLTPLDHVKMQAAAQKWVDSSISKTINCPEDISFEDFKAVYEEAYATGCKGCTTYRPNDVTGSVLSVEPKKEQPAPAPAPAPAPEVAAIPPRPKRVSGSTYKMKWPGDTHAIYITINSTEDGPFEVFFNTKNVEHHAWMVALSLTISAVFRRGGDVSFIARELKEVFDPKGGAWVGGKYVPSIIAAIGDIILSHIEFDGETSLPAVDPVPSFMMIIPKAKPCPSCGSGNTKNESGCFQCLDCGNSKCG